MQTVINRTKSKIRVKRNTLNTNSVHVDVELWGSTPATGPGTRPGIKLLTFGPTAGGVFLGPATQSGAKPEVISEEDFSILIWSLPIVVGDEIQLYEQDKQKIYEQVVRAKKMFLTATGLSFE